MIYDFMIGVWVVEFFVQVNYVGSVRLVFDDMFDCSMGKYVMVLVVIVFICGYMMFGVWVDNVFDIKGDSFVFGNFFLIREVL